MTSLNKAVEKIHRYPLQHARSLETKDEIDFGKEKVTIRGGRRWMAIDSTGSEVEIGITAKKMKDLQILELKYKIAQYQRQNPPTLLQALGSLITPALVTETPQEIKRKFQSELMEGISQKANLPVKKRSAQNLPQDKGFFSFPYLLQEQQVQNEWNRLCKGPDAPLSSSYTADEKAQNRLIDLAARVAVKEHLATTESQGEALLATGAAIAVCMIGKRLLSQAA